MKGKIISPTFGTISASGGSALHRATRAEIDLGALMANIRLLKSSLPAQVKFMAVVKADAYGHGAPPCARAALKAGADCLGVGIVSEGIELRQAGITAPVQVLPGVFPDEVDDLIQHDLCTTLCSIPLAELISKRAASLGKTVGVHLKIDTGMGRMGVSLDEFPVFLDTVSSLKNLRIESVFTHLASADDPDPEFTLLQIERFNTVLKKIKQGPVPIPVAHAANSAAMIRFKGSHYGLVRPGLILYGALPSTSLEPDLQTFLGKRRSLHPVMQWKTRILHIKTVPKGSPLSYGKRYVTQRKSRIATLPVGYADGLSRALSNNMEFLIGGQRVKQVGTICMDLCLADITDIPDAQEGDDVVIFGTQGNERIRVEELAEACGTIAYEVLCGVGKRVPRIFIPPDREPPF